jgi:hypothetical protein
VLQLCEDDLKGLIKRRETGDSVSDSSIQRMCDLQIEMQRDFFIQQQEKK